MRPVGNKGGSMIRRREFLLGSLAALVCAPSGVRISQLIEVSSRVSPVHQNYYGFCDRLRVDHMYRTGQLRGPALLKAVKQGLLAHVPPGQLDHDIATQSHSPANTTG